MEHPGWRGGGVRSSQCWSLGGIDLGWPSASSTGLRSRSSTAYPCEASASRRDSNCARASSSSARVAVAGGRTGAAVDTVEVAVATPPEVAADTAVGPPEGESDVTDGVGSVTGGAADTAVGPPGGVAGGSDSPPVAPVLQSPRPSAKAAAPARSHGQRLWRFGVSDVPRAGCPRSQGVTASGGASTPREPSLPCGA